MSVIQRGEEDEEARRKPMYPDITSIVGPVYTIQWNFYFLKYMLKKKYFDIRNQKLAKIGLQTGCDFELICEGW